jgi:hypothetical protein
MEATVVHMNKFFQRLFLFEKCGIKTKLSKQQILTRVTSFLDYEHTDYYGSVSEYGFFIGEKNRKYFIGGHIQNSFAPIAKAKIIEENGITSVSMVLRMHILVMILFAPIYVVSLLTIVMFPFVWVLLHFAFVKPTKKLKQQIENLLVESD